MSLAGTYTETPAIFLRPRPLARTPGSFILLPLLPRPRPVRPLPAEVWSKVLSYVVDDGEEARMDVGERRILLREKWQLLSVCRTWVVSIVTFRCARESGWYRMEAVPYCPAGGGSRITKTIGIALIFSPRVWLYSTTYFARMSFFLCSILGYIFSP